MEVPEPYLPQLNDESFVCPSCRVLAQQRWVKQSDLCDTINQAINNAYLNCRQSFSNYAQEVIEKFVSIVAGDLPIYLDINFISDAFSFAECVNCGEYSLWLLSKMVYPASTSLPAPNEDLEEHIKRDYREAVEIFDASPRASAALLRLCVEKICRHLGENADLNTSIGNLVQQGLSPTIRKALDYCRVTGNDAVHPGKIELSEKTLSEKTLLEERKRVKVLFKLVNEIAYEMITKPKEMDELYNSLPKTSREQIDQRDRENNTQTDE